MRGQTSVAFLCYFDWISNSRRVRSLLNILQNGGFSIALETHLWLELLVSVNSDNLAFVLSLHGGNRNKKKETQTFLGKPRGLEFLLLWYLVTNLCANALIFQIILTTLEYTHQFLPPKSAKGELPQGWCPMDFLKTDHQAWEVLLVLLSDFPFISHQRTHWCQGRGIGKASKEKKSLETRLH